MRPAFLVPALASILALASPAAAQGSGFQEGELFLYSAGIQGPGYNGCGILRIDPSTGASSVIVQSANAYDYTGSMAFDTYRQRIVFSAQVGGPNAQVWLLDGFGNLQNINPGLFPSGCALCSLAPSDDGRIYFHNDTTTVTPLCWFDAANNMHVLYESDGVTPMRIDGNGSYHVDGMIHDPATNALFVASTTPAPGFPEAAVNVRKLQLSADGSRVVGPVGNAQFEVSPNPPGASSGETPRGWSRGPNGKLVLCILTIDDHILPRMLLVDPVTSAITVWGSNGDDQQPQWALTTSGAYCPTLNQVVVVDTSFTHLRGYSQGSTGGGGNLISPSPAWLVPGFYYYLNLISIPDVDGWPAGAPFCAGDGSLATACPCANTGGAGRGCQNSGTTGGARLTALGSPSADTVQLTSAFELPTALTIFLQGNSHSTSGVVFGDGVRCVSGSLKRLGAHNAVGGVAGYPLSGDPSIRTRSAQLGDPIANGSTRWYQAYYRDANTGFCAAPLGSTFNVSSGLEIGW